MNTELVRNIGSVGQDNLIARLTPAAKTFGVVIRKTEEETVIKRGTLLGKSADDGKLAVYGAEADTNMIPYCILADDVAAYPAADVVGVAYRSGNFNRSAIITADGYTLTDKDEDELRKFDIIFTDTF